MVESLAAALMRIRDPALLLVLGAVLVGAGPAARAQTESFVVRQGTNLSVAADPSGEFLVIDLLGGLWRLPASGGGAQMLIPAGSGAAQPRFDPAGERIVFQRWVDGQWDLWQLELTDGRYEALTETLIDEREPDYSADGRQIAFAADIDGRYQIWSLNPVTSELRQLTNEQGDSRFPVYSTTGELAFATETLNGSSVNLLTQPLRGTPLVTSSSKRLSAPSWRPGGGVLVFNEREDGIASDLGLYIDAAEPIRRRLTGREDVFVGRVAWISPAEYVYAADGRLWRRRIGSTERDEILLFAGASVDAAPPAAVDRRLDTAGPHPVAGVNGLVRHGGSGRIAFSALGDLWLLDDDELTRLTDDSATDAWPVFTPDGDTVIFASDRAGDMEIWQLAIGTRQPLQLTAETGHSYQPAVSADGRYVAFLETQGTGPWDVARLKLIAIDAPFQSETLATGLYDAHDLVWSGAQIRLLARDAGARETVRRAFDTPAQDLPGDAAAAANAIPLPDSRRLPVWRPAAAAEPYVIQAGRVFDGTGNLYSYYVDIHISGQRITDIVRRGQLPLPDRVIDASELTVLPGLIDVHAHHSAVAGGAPGREWLRHGVTTVHEVMADTRAAIERAETWDSGRAPGPRLVISPAAPPANLDLPPASPIVLGGGGVGRSLSHELAAQMRRADEPLHQAPPVLAVTDAGTEPMFAVSTLGRSYQDIIDRLRAAGTWLPSSLGALEAAAPVTNGGVSWTVDRVLRATGRVAIGSDAPAVGYGTGFHRELELLAAREIPNDEILRWATAGGALALGLSLELGTLQRGRLADLILIDGDPLGDISELARIEAVVRGGVWYAADEL